MTSRGIVKGIATLVVLLMAARAWAVEARGVVESVTVYRGQALVTRAIEVDAPAGPVELIVTDLPERVVGDSLFASGQEGVQVRAVRYRTRAIQEVPREEIRRIEAQIEDVQRQIRANENRQQLQAKYEDYLSRTEQFTAATMREEMARGVLNADTIRTLTEFLFQERDKVATESLRLREEKQQLTETLTLLERQRAELTARFPVSRTAREALVFIDKRAAARARLRLSYLVEGAGWSPAYNVRCAGDRRQIDLEYNSLVRQMSGEDWENVTLTLSTASPAMISDAPILTPLWVALGAASGPSGAPVAAGEVLARQQKESQALRERMAQRSVVGKTGQGSEGSKREERTEEWFANIAAGRLQVLDINVERDVLIAAGAKRFADEALSVSYPLPGKISIQSRTDQQIIQIASLNLPATLYYLVVPVLTPYVYQQADIMNTSDLALLAGPVNAYMDGQFMGAGQLPMVAKGQQFTVGFGVDSQLRSARELADKSEKIVGGNKEVTLKYRLVVENYKNNAVKVRLLDRLPDPRDGQIRITLGELKDPLSEDKVYLRTLRKLGILRWEIDVPQRAAGANARIVEYEFRMEFDRNFQVTEPSPQVIEKAKLEFDALIQ